VHDARGCQQDDLNHANMAMAQNSLLSFRASAFCERGISVRQLRFLAAKLALSGDHWSLVEGNAARNDKPKAE